MYDVAFYLRPEQERGPVEAAVIDIGALTVWTGVEHPRLLKTIFQMPRLPPVSLVHHYRAAKPPNKDFAVYSVSIYPEHYIRALGGPFEQWQGGTKERWHRLDARRVRLFHNALFGLIRGVAKRIPVLSVAIHTEDKPMALPYVRDGSICISPHVARIIGADATELEDASGYFVSVPLETHIAMVEVQE
jgi:hypothetical protein